MRTRGSHHGRTYLRIRDEWDGKFLGEGSILGAGTEISVRRQ